MNNKFNIGDRVKIIDDIDFMRGINIGKSGIILNINNDDLIIYYLVEFDTGGGFIFVDDELELLTNE